MAFDQDTEAQLKAIVAKLAQSGGPATEATLQRLVTGKAGATNDVISQLKKTADQAKKTGSYLEDLGDELEDTTNQVSRTEKTFRAIGIGADLVTGGMEGVKSGLIEMSYAVGGASGEVVRAFVALVSATEENLRQFRALSQIGANTSADINELRRVAGLTGLDMDVLSDATVQLGANLGLLGGNAAQGTKRFQKVLQNLSEGDTFTSLSALGFTMNEIATGAAEYLEIQTQLGRSQQLTDYQLTQGTQEYLMNLDLLSRVTGKNRQILQQEQQDRAKDSRMKLFLAGMDEKQRKEINMALSLVGSASKTLENDLMGLIATGGIPELGNQAQIGILGMKGMREALYNLSQGREGSAKQVMGLFSELAGDTANLSRAEVENYTRLKALGIGIFDVRFEALALKDAMSKLAEAEELQKVTVEKNSEGFAQFDKSIMKLRTAFGTVFTPLMNVMDSVLGLLSEKVIGPLADAVGGFVKGLDESGKAAMAFATALGIGGAGYGAYKGAKFVGSKLLGGGSNLTDKVGAGAGGVMKGMGAGLTGMAQGLKAFASPKVLLGAGNTALAIALVGGAIAGVTFLMGKSLAEFAEGLGAVAQIDGKNLGDVALGATKLAGAMAALGAGTAVGGITGFFGNLLGGGPQNFAKNVNETLDSLDKSKIDMYATSLQNLSDSFASLQTNMSNTTTSASRTTGDKLDQLNSTMEAVLRELTDNTRYARVTSTRDYSETVG